MARHGWPERSRASRNYQLVIAQGAGLILRVLHAYLVCARVEARSRMAEEQSEASPLELVERAMGELMPVGCFAAHVEAQSAHAEIRVVVGNDDALLHRCSARAHAERR